MSATILSNGITMLTTPRPEATRVPAPRNLTVVDTVERVVGILERGDWCNEGWWFSDAGGGNAATPAEAERIIDINIRLVRLREQLVELDVRRLVHGPQVEGYAPTPDLAHYEREHGDDLASDE